MRFTKMHGCGNDYLYINGFEEAVRDPAALAVAMSDRRTGVGSDGIIIIAPSGKADVRMRMYNADGSEGLMCGNGIRCIGKYAYERGLARKKSMTVETGGGVVSLELHVARGRVAEVTVAMGAPRPIPKEFHKDAGGRTRLIRAGVEAGGRTFSGTVVSMGNPHFVIEVDDVAGFPVGAIGPQIEAHPDFPSRVNVEFVQVMSPDCVMQRTWERGSGETYACGSGACAAAVALSGAGRTGREVYIELLGGSLHIRLAEGDQVFMRGPAVEVFDGDWPLPGARRPTAKAGRR
jgi:diaminopimelate epimerase